MRDPENPNEQWEILHTESKSHSDNKSQSLVIASSNTTPHHSFLKWWVLNSEFARKRFGVKKNESGKMEIENLELIRRQDDEVKEVLRELIREGK